MQLERLNIFELCDKYTDRSNNKYFVFIFKANGLAFVSGPDKITVNATTGSSHTFSWKLNISPKLIKERVLKAHFGPWNGTYKLINGLDISFFQPPYGYTTVSRSPGEISQRLHWVGDLKRGSYIAFRLVNIQLDDAGDYGVRLQVSNYPLRPLILQSWFTLKVKVR